MQILINGVHDQLLGGAVVRKQASVLPVTVAPPRRNQSTSSQLGRGPSQSWAILSVSQMNVPTMVVLEDVKREEMHCEAMAGRSNQHRLFLPPR